MPDRVALKAPEGFSCGSQAEAKDEPAYKAKKGEWI